MFREITAPLPSGSNCRHWYETKARRREAGGEVWKVFASALKPMCLNSVRKLDPAEKKYPTFGYGERIRNAYTLACASELVSVGLHVRACIRWTECIPIWKCILRSMRPGRPSVNICVYVLLGCHLASRVPLARAHFIVCTRHNDTGSFSVPIVERARDGAHNLCTHIHPNARRLIQNNCR